MSAPERMPDERLADWVDGRMNDREQERFRAELRVNAQLRADLAAYEATVAAVRAALQAPTRPAAIGDRVLAAIASKAASTASAPPPSASRRWLWGLLPAAAALALAFLIDAWTPSAPEASARAVAEGTAAPASADAPAAPAVAAESPVAEVVDPGKPAGAPTAAIPIAGMAPGSDAATAPTAPALADAAPTPGARAGDSALRAKSAPAAAAGPTPLLEVEVGPASVRPEPGPAGGGGGSGRSQAGDDKPKPTPLDGESLRAALAAFLVAAAEPAVEPAAMAWTTTNGELTVSPWLDAGSVDDASATRVWIVDGPKADVAELLAVAARFARDRRGALRNGETTAPASERAGGSAPAVATTQLVLRLKLRRR